MEFSITIKKNPETILDKVCLLAQDKVLVSGNTQKGKFTGLFNGFYNVNGQEVNVFIEKKPMFVSWSMVQKGLNYLAA